MTGFFFSHQVQILHYKLDQYANFQCPGIIGSILECGLLLTFPFLPMPVLNNYQKFLICVEKVVSDNDVTQKVRTIYFIF